MSGLTPEQHGQLSAALICRGDVFATVAAMLDSAGERERVLREAIEALAAEYLFPKSPRLIDVTLIASDLCEILARTKAGES